MVKEAELFPFDGEPVIDDSEEYPDILGIDDPQQTGQFQTQNEEISDPSLVWWKNSPFLYNSLLLHKLEWPSLSVSMINTNPNNKQKHSHTSSGWFTQKLILGTCTSGQEINYLIVGETKFPISLNFKEDPLKCENHSSFLTPKTRLRQGCPPPPNIPNFKIRGKLVHLGDVNRAVAMPQNDFLIATQAEGGKVLFFDYSKHPSIPSNLNICQPQLVLDIHKEEGFGLNYSPREFGLLASCSSDGSIAVWDISQQTNSSHIKAEHKLFNNSTSNDSYSTKLKDHTPTLSPKYHWQGDTNTPCSQNDVCFHPLYSSLLATSSDSGNTKLWDMRVALGPNEAPLSTHCDNPVNCICFNTHSPYIFATGDDKGIIYIWDMRLTSKALSKLCGHKDSISRLQFNPTYSSLLGSSSQDGSMLIWDISKANKNTHNEEIHYENLLNDSAIRFAHHGHTSAINDFCWSDNEYESTMVSTVGWDNRLCCWQMSEMALIED